MGWERIGPREVTGRGGFGKETFPRYVGLKAIDGEDLNLFTPLNKKWKMTATGSINGWGKEDEVIGRTAGGHAEDVTIVLDWFEPRIIELKQFRDGDEHRFGESKSSGRDQFVIPVRLKCVPAEVGG